MAVKLAGLIEALEFVSFDGADNEAFVDRRTGQVHYRDDPMIVGNWGEKLPDDIETENYVQVPGRRDLNLGKRVANQR